MWWTGYYKYIASCIWRRNHTYSILCWKQKAWCLIKVDEYHHKDRNLNYEQSRHKMIERHGTTVIRTNPEALNCINRLINQIYMHIIK